MKILGRALLASAPAALIAVSAGVITAPAANADDEYFDNSLKAWVCRLSDPAADALAGEMELAGGELTALAIGKVTGAVCPKVYEFVDQHLTSYFGLHLPTGTEIRPLRLDQLKRDPFLLSPHARQQAMVDMCTDPAPIIGPNPLCEPTSPTWKAPVPMLPPPP